MKLIKTQVLVLKKRNLPEKNILLTLFSKDQGKINMFGFGIKKITSKRLSSLQTGNLIEAVVEKKNDNFSLKESKLISAFSGIKKDFKKTKYLYLVLFILDRLLPENQPEEKVFRSTLNFLINMSKNKISDQELIYFINTILNQLGYLNSFLKGPNLFNFIEELIKEKIPSLIKV
ncbi:MAG: DNA repair protein RecO [Microgenomates group bacterium]